MDDERERHFIGGLLDGEDAPVESGAGAALGVAAPVTANPNPSFWPEPPPPYSPRPPSWAQMRQPGPGLFPHPPPPHPHGAIGRGHLPPAPPKPPGHQHQHHPFPIHQHSQPLLYHPQSQQHPTPPPHSAPPLGHHHHPAPQPLIQATPSLLATSPGRPPPPQLGPGGFQGLQLHPAGPVGSPPPPRPATTTTTRASLEPPSGLEVLAMLKVGAAAMEAKAEAVAAAAAETGKASPPALPKAGKSYREAVVASAAPPTTLPTATKQTRSNTHSSSRSASRKESEGADDVFEGGESTPSDESPHSEAPSIHPVFPEGGKLGDLELTVEEMAFLAKGTEFEAGAGRNLAVAEKAVPAPRSGEFQKISRRKGAKAKDGVAGTREAREEATAGEGSAASRFQVLSKSPIVRSAKMNNEDRAAAAAGTAKPSFSINNDLHSDGVESEEAAEEVSVRKEGGRDLKLRKGTAGDSAKSGAAGKASRGRREDSEPPGRRAAKRRRKNETAAVVVAAIWTVLVALLSYVHAGLRWLWELVADIGMQLWDIASHLVRSAWSGLNAAGGWAFWRLSDKARGLGRAWRERDWASFLPGFLRRKEAAGKGSSWGLEENIDLPASGEEAMKRLLGCRGQDAYSILGLRADCSEEDIRRYYKRQAVLVHPDKNTAYGAEEAFKILATAFELIQSPEQRRKYDVENIHRTKAMQELEELLAALKTKMEEALGSMQCDCGGKHRRFATKRQVSEARWCRRCREHHAARENDIWAESHWLGFLWYYYACMDGVVYDITEWAGCPRNLLKHMKPNSHLVQYRLITGKNSGGSGGSGGGSGGGGGSDRRGGPPNEAEMEALLSRFLDSGGGGDGGAAPSAASYRPPAYPPPDSGRPRKANRRRKK